MDLKEVKYLILEETEYQETLRNTGYPRFTYTESKRAVNSLEDEHDLEILMDLRKGKSLYDLTYNGLGGRLRRLEESGMIERPDTGESYIELTRLSSTYLDFHERADLLNWKEE